MAMPKATLLLAIGALLAPVVAPSASATDRIALDEMHRYLQVDCEVGETESALDRLLRHADQLLPELARALHDGPPRSLRAEAGAALEESWRRRVAFLDAGPRLGLAPEESLRVRTASRADFLERGLRRFDFVYRERAVLALGAIGTAEARRALRAARPFLDPELQKAVATALARARSAERELSRARDRRNGEPAPRRAHPGHER